MAIDRLGSYKSWGVSWEFVHRRKYDKLRGCIWPDQRRPAPAYASKWQTLIRTQFTFPQLLICPTMARTIKPSVSANAESTAVCAINMPGHAPLGPIAKPISSSRLFFSGWIYTITFSFSQQYYLLLLLGPRRAEAPITVPNTSGTVYCCGMVARGCQLRNLQLHRGCLDLFDCRCGSRSSDLRSWAPHAGATGYL